jgi:hypothetical protein
LLLDADAFNPEGVNMLHHRGFHILAAARTMKRVGLLHAGILAMAIAVVAVASRGAHADTIFSNLGTGGSFQSASGQEVSGNNETVAAAFTPSANYILTEIDIALQYKVTQFGENNATVELVNSASGKPGTKVLESWALTGLPTFGTTSMLGSADMLLSSGPPVVLASGTQYWVVAMTGLHTSEEWNLNSTGDVGNFGTFGTSWNPNSTGTTPAFDVLGTSAAGAPGPVVGAGLPGVLAMLVGGFMWWRRKLTVSLMP